MTTFWFLTAWVLAVAVAVLAFLYSKLRNRCRLEGEEAAAKYQTLRSEAEEKFAKGKQEAEERHARLKERGERALADLQQRLAARERAVQEEANQKYTQLKEKAERTLANMQQTLVRYQSLANADAEAERIRGESQTTREEANRLLDAAAQAKVAAEQAAAEIVKAGKTEHSTLKNQGLEIVERANAQANAIVEQANSEARRLSETAFEIMRDTDKYRLALQALKNNVEGYGDEYVVPIQSVIDELADETSYKQAGRELKIARAHSKNMVKAGLAADCDYSEKSRRDTAIRFVTDAFNGKVDSVLTTVKSTNVGKIEQRVRDAFALVNLDGAAFRNARITDAYLQARLEEVKWAALAQDVKKNQQEEQRRIREQMREEQRVKREIEKALTTAERERQLIEKTRADIEQRLLQASEAEKAALQAQMAEMEEKLRIAEEQGQRAMSMAQQTKKGTVYVISNVGSFGEQVYKIGLTRRLEPRDRVKELGDASVPFAFDIHALIEAEDAPALEHSLHNHFALNRVNKANHRKEYFRCDLATIRTEVEGLGIEATWTMAAEAQEFRETQVIEKRIEVDPVAREQWLNRQLQLEESEAAFDEDSEEEGND